MSRTALSLHSLGYDPAVCYAACLLYLLHNHFMTEEKICLPCVRQINTLSPEPCQALHEWILEYERISIYIYI